MLTADHIIYKLIMCIIPSKQSPFMTITCMINRGALYDVQRLVTMNIQLLMLIPGQALTVLSVTVSACSYITLTVICFNNSSNV